MAEGGEITGLFAGMLLFLLLMLGSIAYMSYGINGNTLTPAPYPGNYSNITVLKVSSQEALINQTKTLNESINAISPSATLNIPIVTEIYALGSGLLALTTFMIGVMPLAATIEWDLITTALAFLPFPMAGVIAGVLYALQLLVVGMFILGIIKAPPQTRY